MGGPYVSSTAALGGVPTVTTDIPIDSVFIVLFALSAIGHMTIYQTNKKRGHIFRVSLPLFGFSMARIISNVLRIAWATHETNIRLGIATTIFFNAGTLILYVVNIVFGQRLLGAACPRVTAHKAFKAVFTCLYVLVGLSLAAVITSIVQSFYTRNTYIHMIDRDIQLTAITYLFVLSCIPYFLIISFLVAGRKAVPVKQGSGTWTSKVVVLLVGTSLCVLIAGFKCGTSWETPRPRTEPAWFDAKWAFYVFGFVPEILVSYTYIVMRVDKIFCAPASKQSQPLQRPVSESDEEFGLGGLTEIKQ
ncbi:hypothetical protein QM012_002166 [Aureobasidium pullulans]|uniref:Uncharacterized protein n=1 Tax=Aureobasidium pullulans TaxID=5580 RepID=A0ABR0TCD9_AURPU